MPPHPSPRLDSRLRPRSEWFGGRWGREGGTPTSFGCQGGHPAGMTIGMLNQPLLRFVQSVCVVVFIFNLNLNFLLPVLRVALRLALSCARTQRGDELPAWYLQGTASSSGPFVIFAHGHNFPHCSMLGSRAEGSTQLYPCLKSTTTEGVTVPVRGWRRHQGSLEWGDRPEGTRSG